MSRFRAVCLIVGLVVLSMGLLKVFDPSPDSVLGAWGVLATVVEIALGVAFLVPRAARLAAWSLLALSLVYACVVVFLGLLARGVLRDAFLIEDPRDPVRELVALDPAVGDGARVTFSLPTAEASPDFRWYPKQGSVVGYVAGVAVALVSVNTDARTVTFAAPPAIAASVAVTYRGLRLVRLFEPPAFQGVTKRYGRYDLALEEVFRE
jgi:hypothetical protein